MRNVVKFFLVYVVFSIAIAALVGTKDVTIVSEKFESRLLVLYIMTLFTGGIAVMILSMDSINNDLIEKVAAKIGLKLPEHRTIKELVAEGTYNGRRIRVEGKMALPTHTFRYFLKPIKGRFLKIILQASSPEFIMKNIQGRIELTDYNRREGNLSLEQLKSHIGQELEEFRRLDMKRGVFRGTYTEFASHAVTLYTTESNADKIAEAIKILDRIVINLGQVIKSTN